MRERYDVVVIGGGIAAASFAYFASRRGVTSVLVLEREESLAYHSTGRSAAVLFEVDPIPTLQALKRLGGDWLRSAPEGFSEHPILSRNGAMPVFVGQTWEAIPYLREVWLEQGMKVDLLSPEEARARVSALDPRQFDGAAWMPEAGALDVHEWHSSYLRHAKRSGVEVACGVEVVGMLREAERVAGVETSQGSVRAEWVVNAAGAWASRVAAMADASPIELRPLRRCAVTYAAPADLDVAGWPLVASDHHKVYFEPETTGLLMSPMDEEPMEPCDARPDDVTIAEGVERLRALAPAIVPATLRHKWAGLRTFAADRAPVIGRDPVRPGFFWLAGQGGMGIETSGVLGPIAADLLLDGRTDRFDEKLLGPARFARG